ncbi:MAG: tRNA pseudouridine(38-40) synthase TruA [Gammaproteobacteria bacterium]|nr:tRNA pseudouridine(38-40) synthase TruA [Gammaproteobacteria bacterium]
MRIALGVEYNGAYYSGWQIQSHCPSVQEDIEKALSIIADSDINQSQIAGRTDKGVHATAQVMHFDTDVARPLSAWVNGTNRYLEQQHISILWAKQLNEDFHARFCARRRRYRYILLNRDVRPAILSKLVSWENRPLELDRMIAASKYLLGEHDFNAYRTVHCQSNNPVKTIYELDIHQDGSYYYFDIEANAFLHHMVRNIVGVLCAIGYNDKEPEWAKEVLDSKDRCQGGKTASGEGLYLVRIGYDKDYGFPQQAIIPSF